MKKLEYMTEPELRDLMNACANQIVAVCSFLEVEKPMFALLLFNDPDVAQYICNCERQDVIKALRECAGRLESKTDVPRQ